MSTTYKYSKEELESAISHVKAAVSVTRIQGLRQLEESDRDWFVKRAEQMEARIIELEAMLKELENGN